MLIFLGPRGDPGSPGSKGDTGAKGIRMGFATTRIYKMQNQLIFFLKKSHVVSNKLSKVKLQITMLGNQLVGPVIRAFDFKPVESHRPCLFFFNASCICLLRTRKFVR